MKKCFVLWFVAALLFLIMTTTNMAATFAAQKSPVLALGKELYRNDLSEIPDGTRFGQSDLTWKIIGDGVLQKNGGEGGIVLTDTKGYNDNCVISVEVRILDKGVGSDWGVGAGLAIGCAGDDSLGHAVTVFDLDAFLMINSQRLDTWAGYSSHEVTNIPGRNEFHTLSVALNGMTVRVFVDGIYLHEFERLTAVDDGSVGLWTARYGRVEFRNLTIHEQDPAMNEPVPDDEPVYTGSLRFSQAFGDNMVLQQKKPVMVFGFGDAGKEITLSLVRSGQVVAEEKGTVDGDGTWCMTLPSQNASFEEAELVATDGIHTVKVEGVLFGEVWVAGGQSNMDMSLVDCDTSTDIRVETLSSYIRFYRSDVDGSSTVLKDSFGHWEVCDTWRVAQKQSAIAYYFAKNLTETLEVPVGILQLSKEGTGLNQWVGSEDILRCSEYNTFLKDTNVSMNGAYLYYNSRVAPFEGFQVAGMLWYQGEAECSGYRPDILREGLSVLNESWSRVFNHGEQLPMIVFELASYSYDGIDPQGFLMGGSNGTTIPAGNEALREAVKELSKTGIAITIPQYDVNSDIRNLHPLSKKPLGDRASDAALGLVYSRKDLYSGPEVVSCERYGDDIYVSFANVGDGLAMTGIKLRGFYLLDERLSHTEVNAEIIGDNLVVIHTAGKDYVYVAYAFANRNGDANLYNSGNYAANPFRMAAEDIDILTSLPEGLEPPVTTEHEGSETTVQTTTEQTASAGEKDGSSSLAKIGVVIACGVLAAVGALWFIKKKRI